MCVLRRVCPGWIVRSVLAAIGAAVVAALPLGTSSALAAGPTHISAPTLLKHACSATRAARAFRAQGHVSAGGRQIGVTAYLGSAGGLITMTESGDETVQLILNGSSTYMKANRAFWQAEIKDSGAASLIAGRWIDVTADQQDFAGLTSGLSKKALLSDCGTGRSATYVGHGTVNGVKVSEVHQVSSQESNTYYIQNGSTPYVLKVTGSASQKDSGDLVFRDFGVQPDTSAPAGAVPISAFE